MAPKQKPGKSKQDYGTPPDFLRAVERAGVDTTSIPELTPEEIARWKRVRQPRPRRVLADL